MREERNLVFDSSIDDVGFSNQLRLIEINSKNENFKFYENLHKKLFSLPQFLWKFGENVESFLSRNKFDFWKWIFDQKDWFASQLLWTTKQSCKYYIFILNFFILNLFFI